jgi:hypothetical protein
MAQEVIYLTKCFMVTEKNMYSVACVRGVVFFKYLVDSVD